MRSILGRISAVISIAGAVIACTGCSERLATPFPAASGEEAPPQRGGTLHLASIGDIRTLDPVNSDELSARMVRLIFAGLVDTDAASNVVPDLATHWATSSDGLVYTFFLRENVRFHDGEELTAHDVKRSVERALHPSAPNPFSSFYDNVVGYEEFTTKGAEHLTGVEVVGRYAVAFHLSKPDATFLPLMTLTSMRPTCKSAGDRYSDTWSPCGAGPFKLLAGGWDHGRSLTLMRHDGYFRPDVHVDAINLLLSVNQNTQRLKFERGELDVVRDLVTADSSRFWTDPRWRGFTFREPSVTIQGEAMNTEMPPFDNVEVRRAVACAVNRDHYRALKASDLTVHTHAVPRAVPGFNPEVPGQKYDLAEALEHMRKAGYPYDPETGRGGYEPHVEYLAYRPGLPEYTAQVLKQDLAKIGIRIDIKIVNFGSYLSLSHRRKSVPFSMQGWTQDYPDALDFYESLFTAKQINDEDASNSAFYKNPAFDEIVERAHHELDPVQRQKLLDRAEAIVRDDAPWAFTYEHNFTLVRQPYVRNYRVHPAWGFDAREVWIDRAKNVMALGFLSGPPLRGKIRKEMGR
ncbi:ABC transporter substrate-binding protein [Pendulispora brunnea]|uniref:ABC transporter substrate-binding protein n=1 Tax=Pendulispora brunnea TaxID=2905690 RepID=A0ABZ2KJS1_9BACT